MVNGTPSLLFPFLLFSFQRFDTVVGQPKFEDWNKVGNDIDGESEGDRSGVSVAMSANGRTIAVGATLNDGGRSNSGHVRVYKLDASDQYRAIAQDINGKASRDEFGSSLAMSANGDVIAVGATLNDGNGVNAGLVQLFKIDPQSDIVRYRQIGSDVLGEASFDSSGFSLAMSADGVTFIVGAPYNCGKGSCSGHARVYKLDASPKGYTQIGPDLDGKSRNDNFGHSVGISADGTRVAVGGPYNDDRGVSAGYVRVYNLDTSKNQYIQVGTDIYGENSVDFFGSSLAMSADGNTIAVGADHNDGNGLDSGHVRLYQPDSFGQYVKVGIDLEGEAAGDHFGTSVAMSGDGTTIAVGAINNAGTGRYAGQVRVYKVDPVSRQYRKIGTDINGEVAGDQFGTSIDMSFDGTMIVVGAIGNSGNGIGAGHVRVFRYVPIPPPTNDPTKSPTRRPTRQPTKSPAAAPSCGLICFIWNWIGDFFYIRNGKTI